VPPGSIQVVVAQPGWALARSSIIAIKPGARIDGLRIVLEPGAQVSGSVVDNRGFPMPEVRVELECANDPTPRSALTNTAGRFALTGALGPCTVTAIPRDLPPARGTLVAVSGETIEIDLTIAGEAVHFQCRVVDSSGFPVVGAVVRVRGTNPTQPTSGAGLSRADGSVEIDGLAAPPYRVDVSHPDFAPLVVEDVIQPEASRFVLPSGAILRGNVLSVGDRSPLEGVRVELRSSTDPAPRVTRAGALGMFEFNNVTEGNYELIFIHTQAVSSHRAIQVTARDVKYGALDIGENMLVVAGAASGTVTDRLGVPVPGARVSSGSSIATTDSEGHFLLAGLASGLTEIDAAHPTGGHATRHAQLRVFAGEENPGVRLQLDGRFVASSEPPPESAAAVGPATASAGIARLGVAIEVATVHGSVAIVNVVVGSHSELAGLLVGDVIQAVDGEPVAIAAQARSLLRGEVDTVSTIDIRRGNRRRRIHARRERFVIPGPP
jgi:hypothetical protein